MKKLNNLLTVIVTLVCCNSLMGQSEAEKKYFSQEVKDTFKNESIVIYRMFEEYDYKTYGMYDYKATMVYRVQYKLNDISAINTFSTLSKKDKLKKFEITQIKPNGKTKVIYEFKDKNYPDDGYNNDPEDEEKNSDKQAEQIPLEDLEIGDIIDYRYELIFTTKPDEFNKTKIVNGQFTEDWVELQNFRKYRYLVATLEYLNHSYAVASSVILFNVPQELKLMQKKFNTQYGFEMSKTGKGISYELRTALIPAFKSEDYTFLLKSYPIIRYTLVQTDPSKTLMYPFQFNSEDVSKDDIVALARKIYNDKTYISNFYYYEKVSHKPKNSYSIENTYKLVSFNKFLSAFESGVCTKKDDKLAKLNKLHEYLINIDKLNKTQFSDFAYATMLARFCEKLGIKYDMIACMPRNDGNWNDVVTPYDITWGIRINQPGNELFITDFDEKSNIYMRDGGISNTEYIAFNPKILTLPYSTATYPEVPFNENVSEMKSEFTLLKDDEYEYEVKTRYTYKGNQKYNISSYVSSQYDTKRLRTKSSFYGLVNSDVYNLSEFTFPQYIKEYYRLDSFWSLYFKDYYNSRMTAYLYDEFHFNDIKVDSTVIDNDGTFEDHDSCIYGGNVYFRTKGLLNRSMSDSFMIMNFGQLITEQFNISNYNVHIRNSDLYNSNQRQFINEASIELPEGYKPVNLDEFNVSVSNDAGSFTSVATYEDGKVTIKIIKTYKFYYLPKEKWSQFVDMIQTAESVYLRKLILTK